MICFYHSADFDGICSGAIVKNKYPDCYLWGINYGNPFPWEKIQEGETVIMCDFSLQPFDDMAKLEELGNEFIWIDHHGSAMNEYRRWQESHDGFKIAGIREIGKAACELTWEYLYPNEEMPWAVRYLGRYDVWDHVNPDVMSFQLGMRAKNPDEVKPHRTLMWTWLLNASKSSLTHIVKEGRIIHDYMQSEYERYARSYSFEGTYDGRPALFCNRGMTGSKLYDSVWNEDKYELMVSFIKNPYGTWTVSLYTTHGDVDCGAIAKSKGGGGHEMAAGYQVDNLDFIQDMKPRSKDI